MTDVKEIYDLAERVQRESPLGICWEWTGTRSKAGYGRAYRDGVQMYAHRLMYELVIGPIPEGLEIDHLCRNRACVKPSHLEAVTHAENMRRGIAGKVVQERAKTRTHCKMGHEFDEENTYYGPGIPGRQCRKCRYAAVQRWRAKKR